MDSGHRCEFAQIPNGRFSCFEVLDNGKPCGKQVSKQSCRIDEKSFCIDHYKKNYPNYDHHLSRCANTKAIRGGNHHELKNNIIDQYNISGILSLPDDEKYCHVSDTRRKERNNETPDERAERERVAAMAISDNDGPVVIIFDDDEPAVNNGVYVPTIGGVPVAFPSQGPVDRIAVPTFIRG